MFYGLFQKIFLDYQVNVRNILGKRICGKNLTLYPRNHGSYKELLMKIVDTNFILALKQYPILKHMTLTSLAEHIALYTKYSSFDVTAHILS